MCLMPWLLSLWLVWLYTHTHTTKELYLPPKEPYDLPKEPYDHAMAGMVVYTHTHTCIHVYIRVYMYISIHIFTGECVGVQVCVGAVHAEADSAVWKRRYVLLLLIVFL